MAYSDALKGYLCVFLAAFFWANVATFGRFLFKAGLTPYEVAFWRAFLACIMVGAYLWISGKGLFQGIRGVDFLFFILFGSVGVGFNYLGYIASIKYIKIATALLILYTFPSIVVILGRIFLKEEISKAKLLSLFLSMLGAFVLLGGDASFSPIGYFWAFVSAIGNATYALVGKRFSGRIESLKTLFWGFLFGSLFLFIILVLAEGVVRIPSIHGFKYILGFSFLSTLLPYMFFLLSFKYLEAGRASIAALTEIPMTSFLAFLFFKEGLGLNHFVGGGLIVASLLFLVKGGR